MWIRRPAPETLSERLKAKRRLLGVTLAQVARYLGWDPGTMTRYLNDKWRVPANRSVASETFLNAENAAFADLHSLKCGH
jgi:transcriptional regulator with XRE-family HTH domain